MIRTGKRSVQVLLASAATAALALTPLAVATPVSAEAALSPSPTYAQAGVTYVGYPLPGRVMYASPPGAGRVEVTVSADGRSISRFSVIDAVFPANPANAACAGTRYSYTLTGPIPITTPPGYEDDYLFFSTMSPGLGQVNDLEIDGSIDPGRMIGRFAYEEPGWDDDPTNKCTTQGNVGWTASAPGGCLGSPEHVQLQNRSDTLTEKIAKLAKKLKKAKRADKDKRVRKLKHKSRKAKSELSQVNQALTYLCNQP
ncbi:hypothetical protein [Nocardioides sp. L-11A]|uniref:hypothetical protein n=1 Tax=Nocardioides sp. L-11A TaxID=3043848 RepID=UPI002499E273|nr:hypothetical protein QJ852_16435 [Nocardioides sp. L-11A]